MTKRIFFVFLAVGMIAGSNAHASRARLLVHGTGDAGAILGTAGDNGSFFVDDAYNMFYNPSYLIDGKNWAIVEHLNGAATAMGGFTMDIASFKLAMFMNRQAAIATSGAGYGAGATPIRPIEVLFAGDTGVKWGIGASYAAMAGTSNTNSELGLRLGAQVAGFDPFFHIALLGKDKINSGSNALTSMTAGLKYHFGEWTPYVAWSSKKNGTSKITDNWGVGIGRSTKVGEGVHLAYSTGYWRTRSTYQVPLEVSAEGMVTSWLTLRGGLGFTAFGQNGNKTSLADATTGRVGATIGVGSVDFDWAVGSNTTAGVSDATTAGIDGRQLGITDNFFSAASLTYKW